MKRFGTLMLLALGVLCLAGCEKKGGPEPEKKSSLVFGEDQEFNLTFESDASSVEIEFSAAEIWMTQKEMESGVDDTWYTLTPEYGPAGENVTITISVKENTSDEPVDRVGVFKVFCGEDEQTFTVLQYSRYSQNSEFVYIKDENFRKYLLTYFDSDSDGKLSKDEARAITEISCPEMEIKSLDGIQFMTSLEILNCRYNSIEGELNLSGLASLKQLNADHNFYSKLDVSGCAALETLVANDNYYADPNAAGLVFTLTEINLNGCKSLKVLKLQDNALVSLDLKDCTELEELDASYNALTWLNVSACSKLKLASIRTNHLGCAVDFSHCPDLTYLGAWEAELTGLNVSGCSKLVQLIAYRNPDLKSVDVNGCGALVELNLYETGITEIDVRNNPELVKLNLGYTGGLTSIDLSNNTKVVELNLQENKLTTLDVSPCKGLQILKAEYNELTSINMSGCKDLSKLYLYSNKLKSIDLSDNVNLGSLAIYENQLDALDVTPCAQTMYFLDCKENGLEDLKLGKMPKLTSLDASLNNLTSLDLRGCPLLEEVFLGRNNLKSLHVRGLSHLVTCEFQNNELERLDLRGCSAIDELHIPNNKLAFISFHECTALRYLDCRKNDATTLDLSNNTNMKFLFAGDNPRLKTIYINEQANYNTLDCAETVEILVKEPSEFDNVGGGDNWGDDEINPWK